MGIASPSCGRLVVFAWQDRCQLIILSCLSVAGIPHSYGQYDIENSINHIRITSLPVKITDKNRSEIMTQNSFVKLGHLDLTSGYRPN